MLGKRRRAPTMKRTTSMKGLNVDGPWPLDSPENHVSDERKSPLGASDGNKKLCATTRNDSRPSAAAAAMISPRYYTRDSGDHHSRLETAPFLRSCGLCNRRLAIGRDIYMYRGDTAFCSEECREQQIKQDERKEKSTGKTAKNIEGHHNHFDITSESSNNGETVAAA